MNANLIPCLAFRTMQEADLSRVMEIETIAYSFPWHLESFKACLRMGYSARILERDDIIGYGVMLIAVDEAEILNICIHPHWQRCGYGRQLLEHLLQLAKQKEVRSVFLEVRFSNETAIHLYYQRGFNQVGIRKRYYPNGKKERENALILGLEL